MPLEALAGEHDDAGARGGQRRRDLNPLPGWRGARAQGADELERPPARLGEQHRHEIRHDVVDPEQIRRPAECVRELIRVDLPEAESGLGVQQGHVDTSRAERRAHDDVERHAAHAPGDIATLHAGRAGPPKRHQHWRQQQPQLDGKGQHQTHREVAGWKPGPMCAHAQHGSGQQTQEGERVMAEWKGS